MSVVKLNLVQAAKGASGITSASSELGKCSKLTLTFIPVPRLTSSLCVGRQHLFKDATSERARGAFAIRSATDGWLTHAFGCTVYPSRHGDYARCIGGGPWAVGLWCKSFRKDSEGSYHPPQRKRQ